jgi:hypothetical protein
LHIHAGTKAGRFEFPQALPQLQKVEAGETLAGKEFPLLLLLHLLEGPLFHLKGEKAMLSSHGQLVAIPSYPLQHKNKDKFDTDAEPLK